MLKKYYIVYIERDEGGGALNMHIKWKSILHLDAGHTLFTGSSISRFSYHLLLLLIIIIIASYMLSKKLYEN